MNDLDTTQPSSSSQQHPPKPLPKIPPEAAPSAQGASIAAGASGSGHERGSFGEVFWAFLQLGLTSFGGPSAHLGYFRTEFVDRRRWLDDRSYTDLVALCQFLPGPSSSQVGMAIGLGRSGWGGALAAWLGFTLPSAVVLILFALGLSHWAGLADSGLIQGLKIVAIAVVAQAVWGMGKSLCPDRARAGLALVAAIGVLAVPSGLGQLAVIVLGALVGRWCLPAQPAPVVQQRAVGVSRSAGLICLALFVGLLLVLALLGGITEMPALQVIRDFYQSGALVFGGGHVVLPLLQSSVVPTGWISAPDFLAGYGMTQAVPGPLFTIAAYLGAAMPAPFGGWLGGLVLLVVIFVPAFLLLIAALPFWQVLRQRAGVQQAMAGVNAAVVGVLGAALYDPLWTSTIHTRWDVALALAAFGLLVYARLSPVWVVVFSALGGWLLAL